MRTLKTVKVMEVPEQFREPGILSGYRQPGMSFREILRSLFSLHHETFNVWSHLVPCFLFTFYTWSQLEEYKRVEFHPFLGLLLASILYSFGSALAHLFNAMSTFAHHVCFMVDYSTIAFYTFGAAIANQAYAFPPSWKGGYLDQYFIHGMFIICLTFNYVLCWSRFVEERKWMKLMRIGPAFSCFICAMLPCICRALYHDELDASHATGYHFNCIMLYIASALIFGSHVPDVLFPGWFDIFFQSHTIFHITISAGSLFHLRGIQIDMMHKRACMEQKTCDLADVISPLYYLAALAAANIIMLVYFGAETTKFLHNKDQCPAGLDVDKMNISLWKKS